MTDKSVLELRDLRVYYTLYGSEVRAVDGIEVAVDGRDVLGIVGESGSGKSTLAKAVTQALPSNAAIKGGEIIFEGIDLLKLKDDDFKKNIAWKKISMIPQAAMNSLDPLFRVKEQIYETLKAHNFDGNFEQHVNKLLGYVDLESSVLNLYPNELSGGMKQRIMILIGLLFMPKLLIADEPTTALDVLTQQHILKKLREIKRDLRVSMILISHDLPVVVENCDRIAIMYAGKIVEYAHIQELLKNPRHPYTVGLLNSHPDIMATKQSLAYIPGTPPSLSSEIRGCRFAPRCPLASKICKENEPPSLEVAKNHFAACYHSDKVREDLWLNR
jgi:oligopeptide/dipeptide ABC transporter ATP-binding protein